MKELARKGNECIYDSGVKEFPYRIQTGDIEGGLGFNLNIKELLNFKACIDKVTAKKWKIIDGSVVCPDCNFNPKGLYNFCPNCGVKLEGVEE